MVCAVEAAAEAEAAGALLVVKVAGVLGVLERWALRVTGWQDSEEALDHDAETGGPPRLRCCCRAPAAPRPGTLMVACSAAARRRASSATPRGKSEAPSPSGTSHAPLSPSRRQGRRRATWCAVRTWWSLSGDGVIKTEPLSTTGKAACDAVRSTYAIRCALSTSANAMHGVVMMSSAQHAQNRRCGSASRYG